MGKFHGLFLKKLNTNKPLYILLEHWTYLLTIYYNS